MIWQPGMPVITEQDEAEWRAWRRERILTAQRERRAGMRRIDYYASPEAAGVIDRLRTPRAGTGDERLTLLPLCVAPLLLRTAKERSAMCHRWEAGLVALGRQPCRGRDRAPYLRSVSRARQRAPDQRRSRPPGAADKMQHDGGWHEARRQTLLARAYLWLARKPDLHRADRAPSTWRALPRLRRHAGVSSRVG